LAEINKTMGEIRKRIRIQKGKKNIIINALVDTGSTTSAINTKLAKRLGMESYGLRLGEAIDGRVVKGRLSIAMVRIGRNTIPTKFIILDKLPDKVVLGQDFFQDHDIKFDFKNDKFIIPQRFRKRRLRL